MPPIGRESRLNSSLKPACLVGAGVGFYLREGWTFEATLSSKVK